MKEEEIKIEKGQYLADVYPLIESNIILNKKLSGVGATHCEIISPRHSIIVVPNVPIITCKVARHKESDNLFGVMHNVSTRDIERYIINTLSQNKFIKIIVTPESFHNVRKAFDEAEVNMYDICFLLLDECHKLITERDFRPEIIQPIQAFFKFKRKALVSATPIIPSDPRFTEQNFKLVKVVPQYYHLFEIMIIETDDIRKAFFTNATAYSDGRLPDEPQCVFVNSTSIIEDLIIQSGLQDVSCIFCSEKKMVELRQKGFLNVHSEWKNEYKKPFMFFTSRFFTGLDIVIEEKPRVLYFSDAKKAIQTLMDPNTDMAQACGRFRNGMKEIYHYVVFNPTIEKKSREDVEAKLNGIEKSYAALQNLYDKSEFPEERTAILNIIQSIPFKEYFTDGEIDYFLKDNIVRSELLKQIYTDCNTLRDAYGASDYFRVPWIDVPYIFGDALNDLRSQKQFSNRSLKREQCKAIVDTLEQIAPYRGTAEIDEIIYTLKDYDKLIVDAFFRLGKDYIVQCNYNKTKIKAELLNNANSHLSFDEAFFNVLYNSFEVGKKYLCSEAKKELRRIYDKFNLIPPSTITAMSLRWHFEIDDKARIGNKKAVKIVAANARGVVKYFDEIKHNNETKRLNVFEN